MFLPENILAIIVVRDLTPERPTKPVKPTRKPDLHTKCANCGGIYRIVRRACSGCGAAARGAL